MRRADASDGDKAISERLFLLREAKHRLRPALAISTVEEAVRFVDDRKVAILLGKDPVASLPEAIAGRPIRGSWMADPAVEKIYRILTDLTEDHVTHVRMLNGKRTVLSHEISPAFVRIVMDEGRRKQQAQLLPPVARQILNRVAHEDTVATDKLPWPSTEISKARAVLERRMLVASNSVHTSTGRHLVLLQDWRSTAIVRKFERQALQLTLENALDELLQACLASAVVAEERPARLWLEEAHTRLSVMIASGQVRRLKTGRPSIYLSDIL